MRCKRLCGTMSVLAVALLEVAGLQAQVEPVPLISQPLVPTTVAPGSGAFTLTINGTGFTTNSEVRWDANGLTPDSVSPTQLTVTIPGSLVAAAGTAAVSVVNPAPGGGSVRSNIVYFPVAAPTPSVTLSKTDYATQTTPQYVAEGDIDDDGDLDLAFANSTSNTVSFRLNSGSGLFTTAGTLVAELQPSHILLRDLDADGDLDLVTSSIANDNISVRLGNGNGTFGNSATFATAENPHQIVAADFDSDGLFDLAVACEGVVNPPAVSVLLGNGDGSFQPRLDYATQTTTAGVAVGDFNLDGVLDLAATNFSADTVSVLLGNGDGTFQPQSTFNTGSGPLGMVAADFDSDGNPDLAVTLYNASTVSVFLGNGNGTFQAALDSTTEPSPNILTAQDFNADGELDLAIANQGAGGQVTIHLGNGDGSFQPRLGFAAGTGTFGITAADFDHDGRIDVAATNSSASTVSVFLLGPLGPAVQLDWVAGTGDFGDQVVSTTSGVQQVKLTNSGNADLTINSINTQVSRDVQTASPDFASGWDFSSICFSSNTLQPGESCIRNVTFTPTSFGPKTAVIAFHTNAIPNIQYVDLSGVGVSEGAVGGLPASYDFGDVAVNSTASHAFTMTNNGTGDLGITGVQVTGAFALNPVLTTCGSTLPATQSCDFVIDFSPLTAGPHTGQLLVNHDGPAPNPAVVNLLANAYASNAVPFIHLPLVPTSKAPGSTQFGMLLRGANFTPNSIVHWNGNAQTLNFNFLSDRELEVDIPAGDVVSATTAEVAVDNPAPGGSGSVRSNSVFFHVRNAASGVTMFKSTVYAGTPAHVQVMVAADFNGDSNTDLAAIDQSANNFLVLLGNGDGTFQALAPTSVNIPRGLTAADFNMDGHMDLAIAHGDTPGYVAVALNDPNNPGTFPALVDYQTDTGPQAVLAADFNADGRLDLAVPTFGGNISVLLRNANGTYGTATSYPGGGVSLAIGDLNGDGKLDLASTSGSSVNVVLGNGGGTFQTPVSYTTGANANSVAVGDFNGDRLLDLAVSNLNANTISILLGDGNAPGTFPSKVDYAAGTGPLYLVAGDFNGDNNLDVASSDYYDSNGTVLLGNGNGTFQSRSTIPPAAFGTTAGDFDQDGKLDLAVSAAGGIDVLLQAPVTPPGPEITVAPLNFPGNPVNYPGGCPPKNLHITNNGPGDLIVTDATSSNPSLFEVVSLGTCATAVPQGQGCNIPIRFTPPAPQSYEATITITSNAVSSPTAGVVTGTGLPACRLLAPVRLVTMLRGAVEAQEFAVEDAKPSCSPVELNLTCSVDNPAACALSPAVIPPGGASTLRVTNLKAVAAESLSVLVNSTSEFRTASEQVMVLFADFALTRSPDAAQVNAGGAATYSLAIRPINGLAGDVSLACSGAPRGATCRVEPSSIQLDGRSLAQVKVRVSTTGRAAALPMIPPGDGLRRIVVMVASLLLASMLLAGKSRRVKKQLCAARQAVAASRRRAVAPVCDRRWRAKLALAAAMLAMLVWASCGGGGTSMNFTSGGTPAGTYTLTISGTYSSSSGPTPGTLTNSTTVTLRVD